MCSGLEIDEVIDAFKAGDIVYCKAPVVHVPVSCVKCRKAIAIKYSLEHPNYGESKCGHSKNGSAVLTITGSFNPYKERPGCCTLEGG